MLNSVNLLGRLAQDPELRSTASGTSVTSFDIAVQSWKKDAPPDYIPVVCWGKTAEFASMYLSKGRQVVIDGRITTRKWTDNEGRARKVVEVTADQIYFADSNRAAEGTGESAPVMQAFSPDFGDTAAGDVDFSQIPEGEDDDLPF